MYIITDALRRSQEAHRKNVQLALLTKARGQLQEAEALLREALEGREGLGFHFFVFFGFSRFVFLVVICPRLCCFRCFDLLSLFV